ncbi:hypothetical protein QTP88_007658 [Uroleucon formosanum]
MAGIHNIDRNSESNGFISYTQKNNTNTSHIVKLFENLLLCRRNEDFCDLRLQTDDGTIIPTHKIVLVAGCPYFYSMFKGFKENNKSLINIREVESTSLQLLIDYIYTGEIMISDQSMLDLMPAANMLQLNSVKNSCVKFLQDKLNPSNCLGIRKFADFYDARELLRSSEELVEEEEFLFLTSEEFIELISHDDIKVPFEEIVFECVYKWVKYEFSFRYDSLPVLMEHVRLPLIPIEYLLTNVLENPLFRKCYYYVTEAINFHKIKKNNCHQSFILTVVKYQYIFALGKEGTSIQVLDLTSQSSDWESVPDMLVGGCNDSGILISAELFDVTTQEWKMVSDMSQIKEFISVGVLNNLVYKYEVARMSKFCMGASVAVLDGKLYAVRGYNLIETLKSAESYEQSAGVWTSIANMHLS